MMVVGYVLIFKPILIGYLPSFHRTVVRRTAFQPITIQRGNNIVKLCSYWLKDLHGAPEKNQMASTGTYTITR